MFVQDNNKPILLQFTLINCFSHKNMANSNFKKNSMIFFVILEGNDIFVKTIFNKKNCSSFCFNSYNGVKHLEPYAIHHELSIFNLKKL